VLSNIPGLLTTIITNLYVSTGLLGIALAMAIESCCIPLPSEIVMPVAGLLLSQHRLLPGINPILGIVLIGVAGSVGCLLGSAFAYWIGFKGGRPLMLKYGRYVLISQHDADKADQFFQKYGNATAFFSRLLPVVRTYISLPAGISKMSFTKFSIYSFVGSLPWCILLTYLGTVLGANMATIEPIFKGADVVIAVLIVVLVVLYVWRHVRNDRRARAEHAEAQAVELQKQSSPWNQSVPMSPQQYPQQQPGQQGWAQQAPQSQQSWQPQQPGQQSQQGWPQQSPQPPQQSWSQPGQQAWTQPQQYPSQQSWPQQPSQQSWPQPGQQAWPQQPLPPSPRR
jgi:membrane protein DedA with SNARE-associated domain